MSDAIPDIRHYARCMGKALYQVAPADLTMFAKGTDSLRIECTITSLQEAEAVIAMIRLLTKSFSAGRVGVKADYDFPPEDPPGPFDKAMALLGASPNPTKEPLIPSQEAQYGQA